MTSSEQPPEGGEAGSRFFLLEIFWTFFRIGLFTLGGGLAMAAVMRHELVLRRRWVKDDEFLGEMSVATAIPGIIAVNMAYLQGRRLCGRTGAAMAILGTILPSFFIILLIAWLGLPYFSHPWVAAFFKGAALAVVGQLAFVSFTFGRKLLTRWRNVIVCLVGLTLVAVVGTHPIWAILVAGGLGYWIGQTNEPPGQRDVAK
jgi:chromate transporter